MTLLGIYWNVSPEIFRLGPLTLRWYGLFFVLGFIIGHWITQRVFRREQLDERWLDSLLVAMLGGAIVGARLGHVFFYDWELYRADPIRILYINQGGLASHGAFFGLALTLWLWSWRVSRRPILWIVDRLAMSVALGGAFIRLGNLMNHEILGKPADLPWSFTFMRYAGEIAHVPRHPAQLYEALCYFAIAGLLAWLYFRTEARRRRGLLSGLFLLLVFGARFVIEYAKEPQEHISDPFLQQILAVVNMGQLLSLPLIALGLYWIARAWLRKQEEPA